MNKITEKIKEQIKEKYSVSHNDDLALELNIGLSTLEKWARILKLKKNKDYKSKAKLERENYINLLKKYYPTSKNEELEKIFNKNIHAIQEMARRYKIKKLINERRKGTIEPLFNNSIESFYWLGFLAADGYISKNGHLMFSQVEEGKEEVFKFAKFVNTKVYEFERKNSYFPYNMTKYYRVNIYDKILGKKIRNMWGLSDSDKKTYSGINLDFIKSEDQACAFLIGFLDGDGWYSKKGKTYKIECHKNWIETLAKLCNKLPKECKFEAKVKYRKDKDRSYLVGYIKQKESLYLREFAKSNNLGSRKKFY